MIMTVHNRSRFVEKVDFVTTPGYLDGEGSREEAGLPIGSGPFKIITDLAILGFDPRSKAMRIESVHPRATLEQVRENTGFELLETPEMNQTASPQRVELEVLRREVDPDGLIIGR